MACQDELFEHVLHVIERLRLDVVVRGDDGVQQGCQGRCVGGQNGRQDQLRELVARG